MAPLRESHGLLELAVGAPRLHGRVSSLREHRHVAVPGRRELTLHGINARNGGVVRGIDHRSPERPR